MAQKTQKKENLPVKVDVDLENGGTITYANEVIATIAGVAANEIDGIAGMSVSGGIGEMLSRNKNITRGVKVEVGSQEAAVDLYIIVEYGKPIQKVSAEVQENVRKALESLTGLHVVRVDVHVQGVSFEKEKKANLNSLEASKNPVLEAPAATAAEPAPAPAEEPKAPEQPADETAQDEALAEEKDFDAETLTEEAQLEGTPEAAAEEAAASTEETVKEESGKKPAKRPPLGGRKRA
jgi:uncharacterized alkaline shock family protein YloU